VLSRCLQFNLKRLSPDQIGEQMQAILQREDIEFEPAAVKSLARAADGSMRDGLSLLDQAIVHGGGRLAEAAVSAMLGTVARQPVFELLEALAAGDAADLLARVEDLALHSPDFEDVLQQMLVILHLAALAQWVPDAVRREEDAERILGLAKRLSAEDLQLLYQIALVGQRDLPLAPEPRMGFEMVLLRMLAFRPAAGGHAAPAPAAQAAARPAAVAAGGAGRRVPPEAAPAAPHPSPRPRAAALPPAATAVQPEAGTPLAAVRPEVNTPAPAARSEAATPAPELAAVRQETDAIPADPDSVPATAPGPAGDWNALIQAMGLAAMTLQLANNCELESLDEESCMLRLSPQMTHLKGQIATGNLEKALQEHFRRPLKLVIKLEAPGSETPALKIERQREERQRAAEIEMEQDENVRALKERFEARIVPGSIKPLD
jgi:DNA polymerase-3 subunit gamma/tau